ncbi:MULTISPECIES: LPS export ABC transporter permease LptG [unclassified Legionella]|uniref:LPS export ABC transporter permease LptG n=1 Tax=unclassified Legionella TaxID=2622702 RepID=UPI00105509FC|nr:MULTISPECIES: LPS export ABC transporter permease LptG [unclassified Legionella]MDI9818087.1 LPS export ABC transporter permease LptG [Legionella sp. PL877]
MKLVDRYIAKTVLSAIALVTLMLAGLQIFILFVNQLDDIGRADFGIIQTAIYVFLLMPYQVYLFFPLASLLGCLIGLGIMANNRELVVMRAAGMSIGQVTQAVLKAALILVILVTVIGETIVPRLAYWANDKKMQALNGGQALRTAHGVWLRNDNDFIAIGTILPDNTLQQVYQFHFDAANHLRFARKIEKISYADSRWLAQDVTETIIDNNQTVARKIPQMIWDVSVRPGILSVSSNEPDEMTLRELRQYLRAQKKSHQTALNYQLAYWQRLMQPLTTAVMMMLAIPFIFGPLRSSTMGSKILAGATVGFGFHIVNRFFGPVSQVFQWPPEVAAIGPTCLFALLGLYLMRRVR